MIVDVMNSRNITVVAVDAAELEYNRLLDTASLDEAVAANATPANSTIMHDRLLHSTSELLRKKDRGCTRISVKMKMTKTTRFSAAPVTASSPTMTGVAVSSSTRNRITTCQYQALGLIVCVAHN